MMLQIKAQLAEDILGGILAIAPECGMDVDGVLALMEYPPDAAMGDIAIPCFKLAKTLRRSPVQIADTLAPLVKGDAIDRAEAVYYYTEIKPTESGNYWYYVDGVPTKW